MSHLPPSLEPIQTRQPSTVLSGAWSVQELENRGRGVVSTATIPAGTVVLSESRPLVSVVHGSRTSQVCHACFALRLSEVSTKFLDQPIKCDTCQQVRWCSEECKNQSMVCGTHPIQICHAYQRLAERVAEARAKKDAAADGDHNDGEGLDDELVSDARMLFYAYYFRRYKPEEFAKWSLLCSIDTKPYSPPQASTAATASSTSSSSPTNQDNNVSSEEAEEEARIEQLHDLVVDCLQFAAKSIAEPATAPISPTPSPPLSATLDISIAPPPSTSSAALALPPLSKQFTDLHISHPSDDLTQSLALDADLAVTRSLYLKLKCNGFALSTPNDKLGNRQLPRGYAIYPTAAMINHSCLPNVARFDKIDQRDIKYTKAASNAPVASSSSISSSINRSVSASPVPSPSDCNCSASFTPLSLELRAMSTIPPYTELTMSYVPLFWDRRERQEQLKLEYGFKCRCERCRLEKQQEKEEQANGGGDHEEHNHDHGDEEEDDEDEENGEDDDEDGDVEPVSDDDAEDVKAPPLDLTGGELNIYLMKYLCPSKICGGQMAPVKSSATASSAPSESTPASSKPGSGESMECNICGKIRTDAQFHRQLAKEFGLRK